MATATRTSSFSPFIAFSREEWAALRASTRLTLSEEDVARLRGINDRLSLDEVANTYLPLSRLLNLYVGATQQLFRATADFLGNPSVKVPFIIGIAGSVAVGKSTTARVLRELLAHWPNHPRVDLVTTDGFLLPNRVLKARGLMERKGFPESYDVRRLVQFVGAVKSGKEEVAAPVYSHLRYDIVPDEAQVVRRPDIMILEGLNVLQGGQPSAGRRAPFFVSDFFDFSIFVDARTTFVQRWYVERFLKLRETSFANPQSYFHRYASLSEREARDRARHIWSTINGKNLVENILPTRERAHLILQKAADHRVERVLLRRI